MLKLCIFLFLTASYFCSSKQEAVDDYQDYKYESKPEPFAVYDADLDYQLTGMPKIENKKAALPASDMATVNNKDRSEKDKKADAKQTNTDEKTMKPVSLTGTIGNKDKISKKKTRSFKKTEQQTFTKQTKKKSPVKTTEVSAKIDRRFKSHNETANTDRVSDIGRLGLQVLMSLFTTLASIVIVGNLLVLWSVFVDESEDRHKFRIIKTTLALLDVSNGVFLFAVVVPNLFWAIRHASEQLGVGKLLALFTSYTQALGVTLLFIFLANLYVIALMAAARYRTASRPADVEKTSRHNFALVVGGVVLVALLVSTTPVWFPKSFTFAYQHNIFCFWIKMLGSSVLRNSVALVLLILTFIPYLSMLITSTAAYIVSRPSFYESVVDEEEEEEEESISGEFEITKTSSLMVVGFFLTTVPFMVVSFLLVAEVVTFDKIYVAHITTFFFFCARSLVNICVYLLSKTQADTFKEVIRPGSSRSGRSRTSSNRSENARARYVSD